MIRAVTVTNYLGESKRFELAFPDESGFAVQSISGLGPSKADINTTEISTNDEDNVSKTLIQNDGRKEQDIDVS